jgi:predicted nucleic acid-binding protein
VRREEIQMHVTVPLALEYEEALLRHREAAGWSRRETLAFFGLLLRKARRHEVYYLWRGHADDPEDSRVLEAAVAAQASRLITFNTGDFTDASQLGVEVMTPGEFLRAIE